MVEAGYWRRWHRSYEDPSSPLSRRLAVVQRRLGAALDSCAPGPIRLISICAGQGRDVIGVLTVHPRRAEVAATLVELDPDLVRDGRAMAEEAGVKGVEYLGADASDTSSYAAGVPADVILVCGVFGNVTSDDIRATVLEIRHLCAPAATVIWTRHRRSPDLTPSIRSWFLQAGFAELSFDTDPVLTFGVGVARLLGPPPPFRRDRTMFQFIGDGTEAHS